MTYWAAGEDDKHCGKDVSGSNMHRGDDASGSNITVLRTPVASTPAVTTQAATTQAARWSILPRGDQGRFASSIKLIRVLEDVGGIGDDWITSCLGSTPI